LKAAENVLEPNGAVVQGSFNELAEHRLGDVQNDAPVQINPRSPVQIIESSRWIGLELGDLWAYRDLFYFLAWRDVKVRY
jgi:hypothetical protein